MWFGQPRSFGSIIPKCLWLDTSSTTLLSNDRGGYKCASRLRLTTIDFVFGALNVTSHSSDQFCIALKSSFMALEAVIWLSTVINRHVSSANRCMFVWSITCVKSLMKIRNSNGPNTDPLRYTRKYIRPIWKLTIYAYSLLSVLEIMFDPY